MVRSEVPKTHPPAASTETVQGVPAPSKRPSVNSYPPAADTGTVQAALKRRDSLLVERRTRDRMVAISNSDGSGRRIFFTECLSVPPPCYRSGI